MRYFPISTLRRLYSFSLIPNNAWSDESLAEAKTNNHRNLLIVLLHDTVFNKYLETLFCKYSKYSRSNYELQRVKYISLYF